MLSFVRPVYLTIFSIDSPSSIIFRAIPILAFREKERLRAKARHDEAQALYNADRNAKIGIARNMIEDGEPIEKIIRYTGLTKESIENLKV